MASTQSSSAKRRLNGKLKIAIWVVVAALFLLAALAVLNSFNYSVGVRTGVLSKLSRRGIACRTFEGHLALPSFSASTNSRSQNQEFDNTFNFSVPDPGVREQLEAMPGRTVTLEYHQKLFALDWPLPFLCVRRTAFEIVGVRRPGPNSPADPPDSAGP
ncbi:hypothetical protein [Methylocystis sp.]|jgi:hypothetical protein|uniref:hypothetical protein n=1 Tax=Methylocystis sp. TaxID=1911079 RepID=UPI00273270CF|nr:hypothetical protein [Methylocystis sp.]MDP3554038.1 hypothetical protein [Methylocystis sp.]